MFSDFQSDCFSLAPDSPCSIRSTSSATSKFSHENRVASSSALIQLDRPANLPAKSQDEEQRHRQEYQEMVEAARKKGRKISSVSLVNLLQIIFVDPCILFSKTEHR